MLRAVDLEYDLVEMPLVGWPGPIASDLRGELRPELRDPHPYRLIGNGDAPLGQKVFDISQAQGETVVRPDGVSDDGARKAVPLEAGEIVEVQHPSELPAFHDAINLTVPFEAVILCPAQGLQRQTARMIRRRSRRRDQDKAIEPSSHAVAQKIKRAPPFRSGKYPWPVNIDRDMNGDAM
ncbi:hypothetical protein JSE7799_00503 [Jannaschia seosinensis]|uniref:Uncharacterized protein n=1 Tax=Jannaschia seosinensis TaxID=313367 RepID=A0A0M7B7L9_9RHOB|nr:hypothetical protein JSE7799_00503 [Jannaschia seosinensis]